MGILADPNRRRSPTSRVIEFDLPDDGFIVDQLGAGNIAEFRVAGVAKVTIDNSGNVTYAGTITYSGGQVFSAATVPLTLTHTADNASVQVAILQGDRATPADGDAAYITLRLSDSAGNQDEQARISWAATTVLDGATQDGDLFFSVLVNGALTEMLRLDGSTPRVVIAPDGTARLYYSQGAFAFQEATTISSIGNLTLSPADNLILEADEDNNASSSVIQFKVDGTERASLSSSALTLTGGSIVASTATTWAVLNTVATTVNAFGAATTINVGGLTSDTIWTGQSFTFTGANATSNTVFTIINTSNNAAAQEDAALVIQVGGETTDGDPRATFVTGTAQWTLGLDNSDGNLFKLDAGTAVGANTFLTFDHRRTSTDQRENIQLGVVLGFAKTALSAVSPVVIYAMTNNYGAAGGGTLATLSSTFWVKPMTYDDAVTATTVTNATSIRVAAPTEGTAVLTNASAIYIENAAGTPVNQHGIKMDTLTSGVTADYYLTLGSTDADHNLIHVGVTGDPIFGWNEASDIFTLSKGLTLSAGALTASGGGSLTGTWTNLGTVTTVDINGGTVDGTAIGGASPATGIFTTLQADSITNDTGLAAGTYTPTDSAPINIDSATATEAQYIRVGNTVTVSGRFTADATITATNTSFELSLPIASNFGAVEDLAGVAVVEQNVISSAAIYASIANDSAVVSYFAAAASSTVWSYTFTYQVI